VIARLVEISDDNLITQELATHRKIMKDEYSGALNWYRAAMQNVNIQDEEEAKPDPNLKGPVLMIVAEEDPISNEIAINVMKQYATNLKLVGINAGHWIQLERKEETNTALKDFFGSVEK